MDRQWILNIVPEETDFEVTVPTLLKVEDGCTALKPQDSCQPLAKLEDSVTSVFKTVPMKNISNQVPSDSVQAEPFSYFTNQLKYSGCTVMKPTLYGSAKGQSNPDPVLVTVIPQICESGTITTSVTLCDEAKGTFTVDEKTLSACQR